MKHILTTLAVAALGLVVCTEGCSKKRNTPQSTVTTRNTTGTVTGKITDANDQAVGGVTVTTETSAGQKIEATANEQGFYVLDEIPPGDAVVHFTHPGYVANHRIVPVVLNQVTQSFVALQAAGTTQTIDGTTPSTVTHRGGSVMLPANSIVDAAGRPVASAQVEFTTMKPGDPKYTECFPGEFLIEPGPEPEEESILISYGVLNVELRDANNNPLELASGSRAEIVFPFPDQDPGLATIPLWWGDPRTARWARRVGDATRDEGAGVYRGQADRFSPWNIDRPVFRATKRVMLTVQGVPVVGVTVILRGNGWARRGVTGLDGVATIAVASGTTATVIMVLPDGTEIVLRTGEAMPPPQQTVENVYTEADGVRQVQGTIMLTWQPRPEDLDSHFTIPTPEGRSWIYFLRKGSLVSSPWAQLNTDDTDGKGPEIITMARALEGRYRYTVHKYAGTPELQSSGAKVVLVLPGRLPRQYTPPPANPGGKVFWAVFDLYYDAAGNLSRIEDINQYGDQDLLLRSDAGATGQLTW